jgi:Protein of unknown function (DUF2937)
MISEILHRYLMIITACIALLMGLQLPNLADQYEKRVDAHLREVTINFQPFQAIANKYFGGSIEKLIALHRQSGEKPFQDEGKAIEKMYQRKLRFEAEMAALKTSLPFRIAHILLSGDREMMDETLAQYSYTVPLNQDALVVGAAVAAAVLLALELLLAAARFVTGLAFRLFHA